MMAPTTGKMQDQSVAKVYFSNNFNNPQSHGSKNPKYRTLNTIRQIMRVGQ